jgi:two-component system cell cycle response regulator
MKILIAEDSAISAKILQRLLKSEGHDATITSDGEQALAELLTGNYRLLISDWMMPKMDGVELCRQVRSAKLPGYTYIILLTARDKKEDKLAALAAGADDFLIKPLDAAELKARLTVAERILRMEQEIEQQVQELQVRGRQLEEKNAYIEAANYRFNELFDGMPVACYSCDSDGRVHKWNRAAHALYGYTEAEALDRPIWELLQARTEDLQEKNVQLKQELLSVVMKGQSVQNLEIQDYVRSGDAVCVLFHAFPLRAPTGDVVGGICASLDITERKAYEDKIEAANKLLAELATTDGLTGLKNHRTFRETLDAHFRTAKDGGDSFSTVLLDVDKFKQYNDSFGHPAGDEVLRRVAKILLETVRPTDCVARYGGEEFALLLPKTDVNPACRIADACRRALESADWPNRSVTASFGVATFSPELEMSSELVDQADQGLYFSKENGRNQVTHYLHLPASAAGKKAA